MIAICYNWKVVIEVFKPKKPKKKWIETYNLLGNETRHQIDYQINTMIKKRGWELIKVISAEIISIRFAIDENGERLSEEEINQLEKERLCKAQSTKLNPARI